MLETQLGWLPHYQFPAKKTPELKRLTSLVLTKWGLISTVTIWALLLTIPLINYSRKRGFRLPRSRLLPKTAAWLSKYEEAEPVSVDAQLNEYSGLIESASGDNQRQRQQRPRLRSRVATSTRNALYWWALHRNDIFRVLFWSILLTAFVFIETNGNAMWLAKRLGRIPGVCLPPILFLSLRPSPLPDTLYLGLLPLHKWMARIIVLQSVAHAGVFTYYFIDRGNYFKIWKRANMYGWVALLGFVIIGISSLSRFRHRHYRFFYINHYIWTWVIVGVLQLHIRPWNYRWYTAANVIILLWQIFNRIYMSLFSAKLSSKGFVEVKQRSPNLTVVEFPREFLAVPSRNPGSHLRLTILHKVWWRRWFQLLVPMYHPYTIASLPSDRRQSLVVREMTFKLLSDANYVICSTYDPKLLFLDHKPSEKFQISKMTVDAKRMLIAVGGSAISFALPLIRVATYHGIPVKVIWVVRDFRDVEILKHYENVVSGDDFEIYVTGEPSLRRRQSFYFDRDDAEASDDHDPCLQVANSDDDDIYENVEIDVEPAPSDDENSRDDCSAQQQQRLRRKRSTPSLNDKFEVYYSKVSSNSSKNYVLRYRETVGALGIGHRVYKGRPCLDHRYVDWCINEGFTQCSGPVTDVNNNLVCCRAVQPNRVVQTNVDSSKVWVVSAGPQGLVDNMKLWATQNAFNFHEESFSI